MAELSLNNSVPLLQHQGVRVFVCVCVCLCVFACVCVCVCLTREVKVCSRGVSPSFQKTQFKPDLNKGAALAYENGSRLFCHYICYCLSIGCFVQHARVRFCVCNNWTLLIYFIIFPASTPYPTNLHRLPRRTAWILSLWGWTVWSLQVPLQHWQSTLWLTRYYRQPSSLQLQHTPGYTAAPWPHPLLQPPTALFPIERGTLLWRGDTETHTHTHSQAYAHVPKASLHCNPHQKTQQSALLYLFPL